MKDITLSFTKMHGLGNDFVIIDNRKKLYQLSLAQIQYIAHRHLGIGCDQILLLENSQVADFFCRIFNADGSEAKQCGNGLRCLAQFIYQKKIGFNELHIETLSGIHQIDIKDDQHITLYLNEPHIVSKTITLPKCRNKTVYFVEMGNEHAIMRFKDIHKVEGVVNHSAFVQGLNIGLVQKINDHHVYLRTFERGVGFTLACGSNAVAAAFAGMTFKWLKNPVQVSFQYGFLIIQWEKNKVQLTGPASYVFSGYIILNA